MALFIYKGSEPREDALDDSNPSTEKTFRGIVFPAGEPVEVNDADEKLVQKLRILECFEEVSPEAAKKLLEAEAKKAEAKAKELAAKAAKAGK